MPRHSYLSELELMILTSILALGSDAYGVPLSKSLEEIKGHSIAVGSVYAALDRLETKGLIASNLGEATPERGGRAKRYFSLTQQGISALRETCVLLEQLNKLLPDAGGIA